MTPLLMDKSLPFSIWSFCVLFKKSFPFSTLLHCWVRMKIGVATMEQSMESLQKTKNRTTIWPCSSTPGHISEQNYNSKIYMQPYVHGSTVHNSQVMEATQMFINRWMDIYIIDYCAQLLSHVWPFETPWTIVHQVPLSMDLSR